ncbi:MAG: HAD-IB family hydrolase [Proteobacteria bacterium]|nr:HAD-IB family hydrolase [Pseudomonadota bacterium]
MMRAAFFDMDHTLLRIDTGTSWTKFLYARGELSPTMVAKVAYWSVLYKLAVLDMEALFTNLTRDLAGDPEVEMIASCEAWFRAHVASEITLAARVAIDRHRRAGDLIVLATGSTTYAAGPVARAVGIEHVLASELEVDAATGRFTGRPGELGFGQHKVRRAERWAARHDVDLEASYFYSDSYNDLPLLSRVGVAIVVNPDVRLRRHARRTGWEIRTWA